MDRAAIITACGINTKKAPDGIEIYINDYRYYGRLMEITTTSATAVRFYYPAGGHSTAWGRSLTDEYLQGWLFTIAKELISQECV